MVLKIAKFGAILVSRQLGKEALAAFSSDYKNLSNETIEVDFENLEVLAPSWADEFLTPLQKELGQRLRIRDNGNDSVIGTLRLLEETNKIKFNFITKS